MKPKMYMITTMSNLHVGSGEYNIGVIDNLVQRDVLNQYPNINASSLKGALREFFSCGSNEDKVSEIFGSNPKSGRSGMRQGSFRFFEANLLSLPVRSDKTPYLRAVTPHVLKELLVQMDEFGLNAGAVDDNLRTLHDSLQALAQVEVEAFHPLVFSASLDGAIVEDFDLEAVYENNILSKDNLSYLKRLFGERFVLMHNSDFKLLCDNNHLPVISRNYLENGMSKNLWYEEVVPRFAQFYFIALVDERQEDFFETSLKDQLVQIGGNATIGYGYSKIQLLSDVNLCTYEN